MTDDWVRTTRPATHAGDDVGDVDDSLIMRRHQHQSAGGPVVRCRRSPVLTALPDGTA